MEQTDYTLIDKQNGNLAFKIQSFSHENPFERIQHNNYYTVVLIARGSGILKSSFSMIPFSAKGICCFSPYQPYLLKNGNGLEGTAIHFHPDFFCIYRHQNEVASNGALFNNAYQSPFFSITPDECNEFIGRIAQMKTEMERRDIAQQELLILHLKIFLISAIRIRNRQLDHMREMLSKNRNASRLQHLIDAIDAHYRKKHKASDYSHLLGIPSKSLARLTKKHLDKTLTDLVSDRIMTEAKRDLYLTSKAIKEIAYTLGFTDEYYFSRFFKKRADISPQAYRDTVGSGREALLPPVRP